METVRFSWKTWTIHSQKMKEPPTKKQRNPKTDIFVPFQFGAKRKCSLNKRKFKSIQNAGFFTSSGETGKFTVEHKRTENFPTKKMEKFMLLVKTEKSQLKKESREFVQPKKKMEKSPFRMEISAFFW